MAKNNGDMSSSSSSSNSFDSCSDLIEQSRNTLDSCTTHSKIMFGTNQEEITKEVQGLDENECKRYESKQPSLRLNRQEKESMSERVCEETIQSKQVTLSLVGQEKEIVGNCPVSKIISETECEENIQSSSLDVSFEPVDHEFPTEPLEQVILLPNVEENTNTVKVKTGGTNETITLEEKLESM